jgi:hypothetical protein
VSRRTRLAALIALVLLLACGPVSCFVGWAIGEYIRIHRPGEPASSTWIRIPHPTYPVSFELPDNARRELVYPLLGRLRTRHGSDVQTWHYWVHAVDYIDGPVGAVTVAFLWITDEHRGATSALFASLRDGIHDPAVAIEFLRQVYLDEDTDVRLEDRGVSLIGGRPARALEGVWRLLGGARELRDYPTFVVPVSGRAALVVLGDLHPHASLQEREYVFPRILRSIRFDEAPPPAAGGALSPR